MTIRVTVLTLILLIFGCANQPIYNISREHVPTMRSGEQPSFSDVEGAILAAAHKRGWSPRVIRPGLIVATITVRSHRAEIEISYTEKHYSIRYKDSTGLDYDDGEIHRNYNRWIIKLSGSIQRELGVRTQNY
jgi:hypothetical protein